ncbi:MAG TPA: hypothetical protein VI072_05855, partial [Polyangiaceae bacterium]
GYIDGLRASAAILVLTRHYYMGTSTPDYPRRADAFDLGYTGVHRFLLFSSFCVAGRLLASGSSSPPPPNTSDDGRRAFCPPATWRSYSRQLLVHVAMLHDLSTGKVLSHCARVSFRSPQS